MNENKIKVIAFYLPQFHPIPENDKWWGKGFTEWTNVGKARPLFHGHYQPKIPADLGYYDLRLPLIREQQAELAKEAGIYGFCYWHYWFGNGKQLLEKPFQEVLSTGTPDFPFCLGWANETWKAKLWNKDINSDKILIEQTYPGKEDIINHFQHLIKAFKDNRYILIDNKPLFLIHRPELIPNLKEFICIWNELAQQNGLAGIFFVGRYTNYVNYNDLLKAGCNAVTTSRNNIGQLFPQKIDQIMLSIKNILLQRPIRTVDYSNINTKFFNEQEDGQENIFPTLIPCWDHSPRSGKKGTIMHNSTPKLFFEHAKQVINNVKQKKEENRIIFLKSWNEWAEGNYMEPDLKYGKGYIKALYNALNKKY